VTRGPDYEALVAQHGSPLLLLDCAVIRRQYQALQRALPGVRLFYALKPLPQPAVVAELRDLGGCFDVATTGEIRLVKSQGVAADRCIHTHPIKTDADIRAALRFGIDTFVVDNPDELRKFVPHRRRAKLLLRLSFRDPTAVVDLSRKFGCEPAAVPPLLALARELGVTVRGFSFHVGSQVADPRKYVEAVGVCAELIEQAHAFGPTRLDLLDIGGGFPIAYGGAEAAAAGRAGHRRTRPLHRGTGGHVGRDGRRPRAARGPLVVLPRRRHVRLVQRPAVRSCALSNRGLAPQGTDARQRAGGPHVRQHRRHPRRHSAAGAAAG
jgi:diaminopimelate decarboxylase